MSGTTRLLTPVFAHRSRLTSLCATVLLSLAAHASDDAVLRLATCQDSWLEWKNDEARMTRFVATLQDRFARDKTEAFFVPKSEARLLGYKVTQLHPQNVGMGVGFSATVEATFEQARQALERQLGQAMRCSKSDGMKSCGLELAPKKTVTLTAPDQRGARMALMGCYYYYEK